MGRLGNQLFIYASLRALSLQTGTPLALTMEKTGGENRLGCFRLSPDVTFARSPLLTRRQEWGGVFTGIVHQDVVPWKLCRLRRN